MKKINNFGIRELTVSAMFIALTYLFTMFFRLHIYIGGSTGTIHLGYVPFFIAIILFGKRVGILSGTIGLSLYDFFNSLTLWIIINIVACFIIGFILDFFNKERLNNKNLIISLTIAGLVKILCFYIGEIFIFNSALIALFDVPINTLQMMIVGIVTIICIKPIKKAIPYLRENED